MTGTDSQHRNAPSAEWAAAMPAVVADPPENRRELHDSRAPAGATDKRRSDEQGTHERRPIPPVPSGRRSAVLFGLVVLMIFGAAHMAFEAQKRDITTNSERNLANIAALKASQISLWLKERRDDAAMLTSHTPFGAEAEAWLRRGARDDAGRRALLAHMGRILSGQNYQSLLLFDAQGQMRLATQTGASVDGAELQLALDAMRTRKVQVGDIHADADHGTAMGLAAPILVGDGARDRVAGAVFFRIDPGQFLYPLIESWPIETRTAETVLVRRDGNEVQFLSQLRQTTRAPPAMRAPLAARDLPAAQVLRGKTGFTSGIDYRGEPVVAYLSRIPDTDWGMVAKVDEAEIYAPIRHLAFYIAIALLVLLAFAAYVFHSLRRRAEYAQRQYQAEVRSRVLAQRFDYLSKYANDIILLADGQGCLIEVNERAVEAYGYSRQQLLCKRLGDLRTADAGATRERDWGKLRSAGRALFETVHQRQDGTCFPVEVSVRIIDADRRRYIQAIVRDIGERKQLEQAQVGHLERIRELGQRLVAVQENERRTLGAELHDRTAANLAAMKLLLKDLAGNLPASAAGTFAERMEDLQALMADTTDTIREISTNLHPPLLDFLGLDTALSNLAAKFGQHLGIPVKLRSAGLPRHDAALETAFYRIAQEALTNCAKHACATRIDMDLTDAGDHLVLVIADDGIGFVPDTEPKAGGLGVITMRERAEFAGGSLGIDSAPGRGTKIRLEIPYGAAADPVDGAAQPTASASP